MSGYPKDMALLEECIGYKFNDREYLTVALTHSSFSNEQKPRSSACRCNERLEFLGDSVLSLITSSYLFEKYKNVDEGDLTKMRAEVVCERALAGFAGRISLGDYLRLGVGEEKTGGRENKSMLSDAFEALLAAMYLDAGEGGFDTVRGFLLPFVTGELESLKRKGNDNDCKTRLQKFLQQDGYSDFEYVIVSESGPDHAKVFEVEVRMGSNVIGRGSGKSKREAEQNAAGEALKLFGCD